jgi:hypothetical protein
MKQWTRFRYYHGRPVFFTEGPPAVVKDEHIFFVAFKEVVQGYARGLMHLILHAVRLFHAPERLAGRLVDKPLLNVVTHGPKRVQRGPRRKLAAAVGIAEGSVVGLSLALWSGLVKITATICMFVFLAVTRRFGRAPRRTRSSAFALVTLLCPPVGRLPRGWMWRRRIGRALYGG